MKGFSPLFGFGRVGFRGFPFRRFPEGFRGRFLWVAISAVSEADRVTLRRGKRSKEARPFLYWGGDGFLEGIKLRRRQAVP